MLPNCGRARTEVVRRMEIRSGRNIEECIFNDWNLAYAGGRQESDERLRKDENVGEDGCWSMRGERFIHHTVLASRTVESQVILWASCVHYIHV